MLYVTVVSDRPETLDDLQAYLRRAGVAMHGTSRMAGVVHMIASSSAVVMFPDDFDTEAVRETLAAIRRARPGLLLVLVTHDAGLFANPSLGENAFLVFPKPASGGTILNAIRAALEPRSLRNKTR